MDKWKSISQIVVGPLGESYDDSRKLLTTSLLPFLPPRSKTPNTIEQQEALHRRRSKDSTNCRKRMPSASVKVEKMNLVEAADPIKNLNSILEKKVRNLEKRKLKLDNYKSDVQNGKELNEDQKCAVNKYDQVVELLDYSKDLCKLFNTMILESSRAQKKLAKKEQIERQQYEIQRLQEALYYKHILSCLEDENARSDFANGENGACKLTCEDLLHLDQLSKLIDPSLPSDRTDVESCFHVLAENLIFLVEGKNKEIAGTTYKELKTILLNIKLSGYFSRTCRNNDDVSTSDEAPELEEQPVKQDEGKDDLPDDTEKDYVYVEEETVEEEEEEVPEEPLSEQQPEPIEEDAAPSPPPPPPPTTTTTTTYMVAPSNALQDVLASQGNFNFLQESQIELDRQVYPTSPHLDPAVVAVHQLPPGTINYTVAPFATSQSPKDTAISMMSHVPTSMPGQPIPIMTSAIPQTLPQVLTSVPHNASPEFDPTHPIPTQTFTNQSFAVMQNMIIPSNYVPVTMSLAPAHMAPIAVMTPISSPPSGVPHLHMTVASIPTSEEMRVSPVQVETMSMNNELGEEIELSTVNGNMAVPEAEQHHNGVSGDKDGEGYAAQNHFQRGYRGGGRGYRGGGRGRGQSNGYGYNNSRGSYSNHYQSNYRRGGPRGGGNRGNGNTRGGRGTNYRPQQQQQQQQHPSQNQ